MKTVNPNIRLSPKDKLVQATIRSHEQLVERLQAMTHPADLLIEAIEECELGFYYLPGAFMLSPASEHVAPWVYAAAIEAYQAFRPKEILAMTYPIHEASHIGILAAGFALAMLEDEEAGREETERIIAESEGEKEE